MVGLKNSQEEARAVAEAGGYYVPPVKLAELSNLASKCVNLITRSLIWGSYDECNFVLKLMSAMLNRGMMNRDFTDFNAQK